MLHRLSSWPGLRMIHRATFQTRGGSGEIARCLRLEFEGVVEIQNRLIFES
jgi:hypothetical protein